MNTMKKTVTLPEVMGFVRANALGIVIRGVMSLMVVVALLAAYYAFAPRKESYQQEVVITLEMKDGKASYPNGKIFSSADLISAPVLNRVWRERKLIDRVKFEDFCKWFSLIGYDRERMKLDAEYQTKMAKRNITVTELESLQREYEAKIAAMAANNRYVLSMTPGCNLSREDAVEILSAVPAAWFAEYSVLNAPTKPAMMRANVLTSYMVRMRNGDGRAIELLDAIRLYCGEISAVCAYVRNKILRGRNAVIDGVDIGAYESRLNLARSELLRIKNKVLVCGDPTDLDAFVNSRIDDMACDTMAAEEKAKAIRQIIDLLKDANRGEPGSGATAGKKGSEGAVTLQADASFFQDFTAMVRRDASQESVAKFADELSQYMKDLADIKARKLYYDQISAHGDNSREHKTTVRIASKQLCAEVEAYVEEILDIGTKVTSFCDRALEIYRTADQFYALPEPARYGRSFVFSVSRLALGLLALWLLYNVIFIVTRFNQ